MDFESAIDFRHWLSATPWLEWNAVYTVTLDHLFENYLEPDDNVPLSLKQDLRIMSDALEKSPFQIQLPSGWNRLRGDQHALYVASEQHPDRVFALCAGMPVVKIPGSFFTQVVAIRKMREIVEQQDCHMFVPKVNLIPLASKENIKSMCEGKQPYAFALVIHTGQTKVLSLEMHSYSELQNILQNVLENDSDKCWMLAKLCCMGFPVSMYFWTMKRNDDKTTTLGIIIDAMSCVVLHEPDQAPDQYCITHDLGQNHLISRMHLAEKCLENMLDCAYNKLFRRILKVARYELETMVSQSGKTYRYLKSSGLYNKPWPQQIEALWWIKNK